MDSMIILAVGYPENVICDQKCPLLPTPFRYSEYIHLYYITYTGHMDMVQRMHMHRKTSVIQLKLPSQENGLKVLGSRGTY